MNALTPIVSERFRAVAQAERRGLISLALTQRRLSGAIASGLWRMKPAATTPPTSNTLPKPAAFGAMPAGTSITQGAKSMADTNNLDLWNRLGKTDPAHTKKFSRAGGFKGTAIKPIYT